MRFFSDLSLSAAAAGFVAVLVGFTSSVAIVFQAAQAFGATPAQLTSWMWALGLGMGLCSAVPSLVLRKPVMVAWSTPGAAVLATAGLAGGVSMAEAVGAFMASAALITLAGATGWFERVMNRIPMALASALLAGVLARFGLQAFTAAQTALPLVLAMLAAYLLARRLLPRYAVVVTLAVGVAVAAAQGRMRLGAVPFELARAGVHGAGVHVRRLRQPGAAAVCGHHGVAEPARRGGDAGHRLHHAGVAPHHHDRPGHAGAGALRRLCAQFQRHHCGHLHGPEAHEDPDKRYTAAVACGVLYTVLGLFGAVIAGLLTAFPKELVAAIAGLALLGTIGGGLAVAVKDESHREAALITFLVTLSGVVLAGIGSAFWGVVAGSMALFVQQYGARKAGG
jgi:benzoate membrane transport protein